jgi:hypothetical protein
MNEERTRKMITDRSPRTNAIAIAIAMFPFAASFSVAIAAALTAAAVPAAAAERLPLAAALPAPLTCDDIRRQVGRVTLPAWLRMDLEISGQVTAMTCSELDASPARAAPAPLLDFELGSDPEPFPRTLCPECTAHAGALYGPASLWSAAPAAPGPFGLISPAPANASPAALGLALAAPDVGIAGIELELVQIIQDQLVVTQTIALDPQFVDALAAGGQHDLYVPVYTHPAATDAWLHGTIEDLDDTSVSTVDAVNIE